MHIFWQPFDLMRPVNHLKTFRPDCDRRTASHAHLHASSHALARDEFFPKAHTGLREVLTFDDSVDIHTLAHLSILWGGYVITPFTRKSLFIGIFLSLISYVESQSRRWRGWCFEIFTDGKAIDLRRNRTVPEISHASGPQGQVNQWSTFTGV